jgi:hypothetical protein
MMMTAIARTAQVNEPLKHNQEKGGFLRFP